ncbi:DAO-domain-containing protein [Macrolepiota fuliginosa MF-IS2]|uniref:DAO-domain-containing protein n=1 Tax=Macrolepiota fuliginosa MF-IS2 TaxID=1400762 RepID=A0A9P5XAK5_9AGAR|nr:DAO-domain-containing protein [Macrolepiota fuliginosa MF-IS2]
MPRRSSLFIYTLISTIIISVKAHNLDQQIPLVLSNHSHPRPSWSSPPVSNPTKSFWTDTPNANPLAHEGSTGPLGFGGEDVDVCVIGSGITGISAVYHLHRYLEAQGSGGVERKVVVLEAREFCSGATGRNGGHLTRNPFSGYAAREHNYGKENAKKTYRLEDYVSSSIADIVHSHGLVDTVDLVKGDHITLFFTEEEEKRALQDYKDAKEGGVDLDGVKFLDRTTMFETYGANYSGVFFPSYNLWPLKFVSGLHNITSSTESFLKLKLHTLTPVTSIDSALPSNSASKHTKWIVTTPRGALTCKNIIHATNAYAPYLLPQFQDRIIPTRGQIIALRAKTSLDRLQRLSWQANLGYEYWFPRPEEKSEDGECKPPLVILGGGRDTAGPGLDQYTVDDSVLNGRVSKTLREFLPDLFACTGMFEEGREPEMEWTGIMGFTPNGAPIVGPIEGLEGQYIAAGFTGHGMPRAFAAAEAVAGMITSKMTGTEWEAPEWLPEHYLTTWEY